MKVKRYEVTESDGPGRIVHSEHFGPHERAEAIQYRQEHPRSAGWTISSGLNGGESIEAGLHASTTYEES